jgi:hypothetical protein
MRRNLRWVLIASAALSLLAIAALVLAGIWRQVGSPGPMSKGHADLACDECHVDTNTGRDKMDAACLDCHRDTMGAARNAHSPAYFEIVGGRETPWHLDPSTCVDCHHGHQRETDTSALSFMPHGYCVACHADVQERVTAPEFVSDHGNFDFSSCQGCHRFHERTLFKPEPRED